MEGDLYTNSDSTGTRNFFLQTADHAAADYVLETKLTTNLAGGYGQGGIIVYTDDDNYVKLDAISDVNNTRINRIELRSETAAAIGNPQPEFTSVPTGTTTIWLRLTKAGTSYTGEYSFDGTTWTAMSAAVTHAQTVAEVRPLHARRAGGRHRRQRVVRLLQGQRLHGLRRRRPDQRHAGHHAPRRRRRRAGFAPLATAFTAAATDADNDALTYSWDFDGNGTTDATGATVSTTFTTAGTKTVKLTVTDGKGGTATQDVPVQVLAADNDQRQAARAGLLEDRGVPPRRDPDGRRRHPGAWHGEELAGRQHRGRRVLHGRDPEPLRRRDLQLDDG